jgi:DNA-binding response OmpR family regulator
MVPRRSNRLTLHQQAQDPDPTRRVRPAARSGITHFAVLDRDIPGPSGDEIAERIVAAGSGMPILMLTAR